MKPRFYLVFSVFLVYLAVQSCKVGSQVSYSDDVKPILNKHCLSCHGGVKKQGGFSLLFENEALSKTKSGKLAIVRGNADASEMIKRITSTDPEERMPHHKNPLSKNEINVLKQWINEGAKWELHWAYKPVKKPSIPDASGWAKTDIDKFIFNIAKKQGLEMSEQADAITLARRVSLDLVGFPLKNNPYQVFIKNPTDLNYESYVNSLLGSKNYGEKWTSMWLDISRYADTKGYERDGGRSIWKYRDWLIDAFNADVPYDRFLKEQIAGDLLPNPTESQYVATAFHRNTMTNDEGGTDNEEFRVAAVIDRVNTTWETLMGTTFACVQCHSHPYDPFTHEEYYKFYAFFNNTRDEDSYEEYPVYRHYSKDDQQKLSSIENWYGTHVNEGEKKRIGLFLKTLQPSYPSLVTDEHINAALYDTKWLVLRNPSSARLKDVVLDGMSKCVIRYHNYGQNSVLNLRLNSPTGPILSSLKIQNVTKDGWEFVEIPLLAKTGKHHVYLEFRNPAIKDPTEKGLMIDWIYFSKGLSGSEKPGFEKIKKDVWDLVKAEPEVTTPIFVENPSEYQRKTQIFERGSFLNKTKEVTPGVPAVFGKNSKITNRIELADWLSNKDNPLVSRTMINRLWEQLFGTGLVETLEDLGSQSASPISKELLDYLSWTYMNDHKWSTKKMLKDIVLSATYRQTSVASPEKIKKDQFNTYLSRGPRVRLSAEQIRDQALAVTNSLNSKMYGPPVMPYQPEGIWKSPYGGSDKWKKATGDEQYRRALYTFWKRTSPYPSMVSFDGVGRELCLSRRIRTNTPLQAFVTLNDSVYIDLALRLAKKSWISGKNSPERAISVAYNQVMGKDLSKAKREVLMQLFVESKKRYTDNKKLMLQLTKSTDPNLAAMTLVCNSILNLDEVITKS